jgi:predicted amidohydrolase YtcJ
MATPTFLPDQIAPDLILHNGKVVTVDSQFSIAQSVAIKGSRIVAVGSDQEMRAMAGRKTGYEDLGGKTVIPGLIDSHIHAFGIAVRRTKQLVFSEHHGLTLHSMLEEIKQWADITPPGEWVVSRGPHALDFIADGRLPDRWELDTVTGDHPFYLMMQGHLGVVNSRALELAGIDSNTPDPEGGRYYRHPETGEPTGLMLERPAFQPFLRQIPDYTMEDKLQATREMNEIYASLGITSLLNPGEERDNVAALEELWRRKQLAIRWNTLYWVMPSQYAGKPYDEVADMLRGLGPANGFGDEWLRIGGIKLLADGGFEGAYMREPFMEDEFGPGWRGIQMWDTESLTTVLRAARDTNCGVFIHELGDAALDQVLDVMDTVDQEKSITGRRWTLEHGGILPSAHNLEQARRMGIVVSTQQPMGWAVGATTRRFWGEKRGSNMKPNRTWLDAGVVVKGGSDVGPFDPMLGLWTCVTRTNVSGEPMDPSEAITREDALRIYTINGAYGTFEEDNKGSIEPGKLADMVVLSEDVLTVPEEQIRDIRVLTTYVGGREAYRA